MVVVGAVLQVDIVRHQSQLAAEEGSKEPPSAARRAPLALEVQAAAAVYLLVPRAASARMASPCRERGVWHN